MENKDYQVLIVGEPFIGSSHGMFISDIHDQLGKDLIVVTAEEAKERGITINQAEYIKPFPPLTEVSELKPLEYKDGQQNRRERRAQQRKNKK